MSARAGGRGESIVLIVSALDEERPELTELTRDNIVAIDLAGEPLEGAPSPGERFLHTALYQKRPEIGCVIHYHSTYTAAFGNAGIEITPDSPLCASLDLAVRVHPFGGLITTPERGEALAETVAESAGALLPGHGAVVVGRDVKEAVARVFALEEETRTKFLTQLLGGPAGNILPHECGPDMSVASAIWLHLSRQSKD